LFSVDKNEFIASEGKALSFLMSTVMVVKIWIQVEPNKVGDNDDEEIED